MVTGRTAYRCFYLKTTELHPLPPLLNLRFVQAKEVGEDKAALPEINDKLLI